MGLPRFIKIGALYIVIVASIVMYGYALDAFYPAVLPVVLVSMPVLAVLFWSLSASTDFPHFNQRSQPQSPESRAVYTTGVAVVVVLASVLQSVILAWDPQWLWQTKIVRDVCGMVVALSQSYVFSYLRPPTVQPSGLAGTIIRFRWIILFGSAIVLWASAIYLAAHLPQIHALDPEYARHRVDGLIFAVLGSSLLCSSAVHLRGAQPQSGGPEADDGAFRPMRAEWNDIAILIGLIAVMAGSINFAISLRSLLTAHLPIVIALVVATCMIPVGGPTYLRQTAAARRDWQLQRQTTHMAPTARVESRGELYAWLLFLTGGFLQQVILVAHQFERGASPQRIAFTLAVAVILLLLCGVALRHLDRSALGERR